MKSIKIILWELIRNKFEDLLKLCKTRSDINFQIIHIIIVFRFIIFVQKNIISKSINPIILILRSNDSIKQLSYVESDFGLLSYDNRPNRLMCIFFSEIKIIRFRTQQISR